MGDRVCSVDGCDRGARAKGMGHKHYSRWRRNGDPLVVRVGKPPAGKKRRPRAEDILGLVDLGAIAAVDVADESWRAKAACAGVGYDVFFPSGPESENPAAYRRARGFCESCQVRTQCLATHLHEDHGCWGATPRERKAIVRALAERRRAVA